LMQVLDRRPSDGKPVKRGGSPPDLIENNQRTWARLIKDGGGFHHFHHKSRPSARQIIGGADPTEKPVNNTDMSRRRRNESPHLRQDGNQRILPQKSAFTGHVRPGQQP